MLIIVVLGNWVIRTCVGLGHSDLCGPGSFGPLCAWVIRISVGLGHTDLCVPGSFGSVWAWVIRTCVCLGHSDLCGLDKKGLTIFGRTFLYILYCLFKNIPIWKIKYINLLKTMFTKCDENIINRSRI